MRQKLFLIFSLMFTTGCGLFIRAGVAVLYKPASLPDKNIRHDICYREDGKCDGPRQTLDLYVPEQKNVPTILFVHGGSWVSGDKQLKVGGADVYANIGRFYASKGIAVAVMNYRLQPTVSWRDQVGDVTDALLWVQSNARSWNGNADNIYLMGHSAGAELVSFVALTASQKAGHAVVKGVVAVSGAGYDMSDSQTYQLGADLDFYRQRFQTQPDDSDWQKVASPVSYVSRSAPPFLILYAKGESKALQHQAHLLETALRKDGGATRLVGVPGESHTRIVLTLSRDDKTAGPAILEFVR